MRARAKLMKTTTCLHLAFNRKRNFTHLRILHRCYSHRVTIFVPGTRSYDDFYEEKEQAFADLQQGTRMKTTPEHCAGVFYLFGLTQ